MEENTIRLKQIALLLGELVLRSHFADAKQIEKILLLTQVGFSNQEIAEMLGTTTAAISVRRAENKRPKPKSSRAKPK